MPESKSVLHPDLRGRVAVVTGASRGIGRALAIRLAREGADVAVAAKSEQSTERLPGSIHETADAIRALGRRSLAIPTDVRDEDAIRNCIERIVAELGRLDILVNNAGAIWVQPILQTPPKRFDLMMEVNARAAYIACYYALPHMVNQQWGHVLNMCPQLTLAASPGKVAYMISKLGMARVALGVAAEHKRDNIAGNTLRPRTINPPPRRSSAMPRSLCSPRNPAPAPGISGSTRTRLPPWPASPASTTTGAKASLRRIPFTSTSGDPPCPLRRYSRRAACSAPIRQAPGTCSRGTFSPIWWWALPSARSTDGPSPADVPPPICLPCGASLPPPG